MNELKESKPIYEHWHSFFLSIFSQNISIESHFASAAPCSQCSGRLYSPESWTLDGWQLSFITTEATEILLIKNMTLISVLIWTLLCCCFTGKVQRIKLLSSMNIRPSEMKPTKPWRCFMFLSLCPQSPEDRSQWLSLEQWALLWDAPSPSAVGLSQDVDGDCGDDDPVTPVYPGTNRKKEKLLSC